MKTFKKEDFLPILKDISTLLEKNEIKYEIPFVYVEKQTFNHAIFIIPKEVSVRNLSSYINFENIKENKEYIIGKYNDLDVFFIQAVPEEWYYKLYYYSWNILHSLIGTFYKEMGFDYRDSGMFFDGVFVTRNLEKILSILGMEYAMPLFTRSDKIKSLRSIDQLCELIVSSDYFNANIFNIEKFKELDPIFEWNKEYYYQFLETIEILNNWDGNYKFESKDHYMVFLNEFVPDFLEKVFKEKGK
jgi:hypothetical protein